MCLKHFVITKTSYYSKNFGKNNKKAIFWAKYSVICSIVFIYAVKCEKACQIIKNSSFFVFLCLFKNYFDCRKTGLIFFFEK